MLLQLLLNALGPLALCPVAILSGALAVTIYLLRFKRATMCRLYRYRGCHQWINLVCRLISQQPPVDVPEPAEAAEILLLREPRDFEWASGVLKKRILGQDAAIDSVTDRLMKNVMLRRRREKQMGGPPVGAFLLLGSDGIGKRTFGCHVAQMLYRTAGTTLLRLDDHPGDQAAIPALFGRTGQEGLLLGPVKRQPYHTVILENIETAGPKLMERIEGIVGSGQCVDPTNGAMVSFQHCLLLFTTRRVPLGLDAVQLAQMPAALRQQTLFDTLVTDSGLSHPFVSLMNDLVLFADPDDLTKARVVLLMIERECRKYNLRLAHVEPEIVAEEVAAFSDTYGFQLMETRISKWLREPMVKASQHHVDDLVLTREMLLVQPNQERVC